MINRFSEFLVEEEKTVFFTFGRMNPPTIGHGKLLDKLASKAGRNSYKIYLSQSQDKNKNPLHYKDKIKHVRKMFPKHARSVIINSKVRTAIEVLTALYNEGYKRATMVVGSDRVNEFDILMNKYNGKKSRHGFYNFEKIMVISAGERDPDSEGASGASATKQRQSAKDNNFTSFAQGLPNAVSNANAKQLFNAVRKGMGLKEQADFKNHIQLDKVSDRREAFIKGNLFETGEQVIIKKTNEVGTITILGSNYVIVETSNNKSRQWLDAVEKIEEKKLTPNEKKKREEVAKAIHRDDPTMPMDKKMAIATSVAKKAVEETQYNENVRDTVQATKLLVKFYKTRKDEDAFKAIKFGWSYIQNPQWRKAIVILVKNIARMHGHRDWKGTVEYIRKNTGVDISNYRQDWNRVKGGYTFTKFIPEESTDRWYKNQPEWGTDESTAKAKTTTPGEKGLERASKVMRNRLVKKRKQSESTKFTKLIRESL